MEGNNCSDLNSSNSKSQEELSNNGNISKKISNKIYFNSITGEQINKDDGDEADLYEIIPDLEQNAQDNITQYIDISDKDKLFFNIWNSFVKSKEDDDIYNLEKMIVEFLENHSKEIYENQLRKNFVMHLIAVYDNNQINDENLTNIIDFMDKIFEQYDKKNKM